MSTHNQTNNETAFLTVLARRYETADGERLIREAASLPVQAGPKRKRRPGFAIGFGSLAAACLILLVVGLMRGQRNLSAAEPDAPRETAAVAATTPKPASAPAIPLRFTMPQGYAVTGAEQDRGESVYHILDPYREQIVLTLREGALTGDMSAFPKREINGFTVYGRAGEGYAMLLFEKDGVVYVLTCQSGTGTLELLSETILN
ncbi:MAG: hypothetical protein FWF10_08550 [Clostridiales bacterium]|nr:hypothetical protein [Clostridiales bacterium]